MRVTRAIQRAHFILFVRDQAASAVFYARVFGCAPTLDVPGMTELALLDGVVLGLMPEAGIRRILGDELPDPARAEGVGRSELYLMVDDPAAWLARAEAAGAPRLSALAPRNWGHDVAYCADPDGHVLAFARPTA